MPLGYVPVPKQLLPVSRKHDYCGGVGPLRSARTCDSTAMR
jgi:hypothetical protein